MCCSITRAAARRDGTDRAGLQAGRHDRPNPKSAMAATSPFRHQTAGRRRRPVNNSFSAHQRATAPYEQAAWPGRTYRRRILLMSVVLLALAGLALAAWLYLEELDKAQDSPVASAPLPSPPPLKVPLPPPEELQPPSFRATDDLTLDLAATALSGHVAAWVGKDRALYLLHPGAERCVLPLAGAATDEPTCLALSPDGRFLAAAMPDRTVRVWDAPAATELGRLPAARARIVSASFSPDGRLLFTCTQDAEVTIWDL